MTPVAHSLEFINGKWVTILYSIYESYIQEVTIKPSEATSGGILLKQVLENFANFTGKHLCWSLLQGHVKLRPDNLKWPSFWNSSMFRSHIL